MDHLQACPYCPKYNEPYKMCTVFRQTAWVNLRGGCGMFPLRDLPEPMRKKRVGQQKQKHQDKSYHSKNDTRTKFRRSE
jgi:hypothetical protein